MMSFEQIERARRVHGLTRIALYTRARVNGETYRRTEHGKTRPNIATLEKLEAALNSLIEEQGDR